MFQRTVFVLVGMGEEGTRVPCVWVCFEEKGIEVRRGVAFKSPLWKGPA